MAWWKELFGKDSESDRVDYYDEGLALVAQGKYHEGLTSFRLALKESPGDPVVLQQIAICYTRIGMTEEAAKTYRHVLQKDPSASGAHYGLAFLLLRSGEPRAAIPHLRAFLASPPSGPEAQEHVLHAREALEELTGEAVEGSTASPGGRGQGSGRGPNRESDRASTGGAGDPEPGLDL
ncbi:MAG: tetratricopeptide repeat protein [Longimicrobiales bacterium]|nr:tetratricopeptide repeat protein [Longimicrobiales bacterium]